MLFCLVVFVSDTFSAGDEYREVHVTDGGRLTGTISYEGPSGIATRIPVHKNQHICGTTTTKDSVVVDAQGRLQNAVVYLLEIPAGKRVTERPASLDNRECRFVPPVQTLMAGQRLELRNSDNILHNVHARGPNNRTLFNFALPHWSTKLYTFREQGPVTIRCDVLHTWMEAHVFVSYHPYSVVTNASGYFVLTEIPAGEYQVGVWHEQLGTLQRSVSIAHSKETIIRLQYQTFSP